MKFHIDKEKYIDSGLVSEKEHPTFPLLIYNYTPMCQFSKAWDEVTMMCRGLIVNKETREIVARPFKKFFNYEEHIQKGDALPDETPNVYKKLDGSLGILYWWEGLPYIATRGSFVSDQAQWATNHISNLYLGEWDQRFTYLFEIIYPENRIVVSYGSERSLTLLAIIDTESGKTMQTFNFENSPFGFVEQYSFTSYDELKKLNTKNEEGFVLHYPTSDFRMKIKFEDYVKLHKVITGLSQIGIWEMLRDGVNVAQQDIPDEMHEWVNDIVTDLMDEFYEIESEAGRAVLVVVSKETRKEQAEIIGKSKYPSVSFAMLDNKDYKKIIWKMIRPRGSFTFRKDIDA